MEEREEKTAGGIISGTYTLPAPLVRVNVAAEEQGSGSLSITYCSSIKYCYCRGF